MSGDHDKAMSIKITTHHCPDWDGLKINCDDDEYECCTCPQYNGGTLRFTKDEMSELIGALEDAVYLLDPTEEDMQKKAGVYRVVNALEKLKEKNA